MLGAAHLACSLSMLGASHTHTPLVTTLHRRDLKPENVLLTADAHIKVIDFGTAKLLRHPIKLGMDDKDAKPDRRGRFKEFVGTPEYMAPEAINNKQTDQRADLWSFGCFLGQIVTGALCARTQHQ